WVTRSWAKVLRAMRGPPEVWVPGSTVPGRSACPRPYSRDAPVVGPSPDRSGRRRIGRGRQRRRGAAGAGPVPSDGGSLLIDLPLIPGGLRGREAHRLHPALVDLGDLEGAAVDRDRVPGLGDATQLRHEEAADGLVAAGVRQGAVARGLERLPDRAAPAGA